MFKSIFVSVSLIALTVINSTPAFAVATPTFPNCANPQGDLKVSYNEGVHGIVGSNATYTGKDSVYTLSSDTLTQCFCDQFGSGIQTNWWKISNLSDSDLAILKSDNWYYIPTGSLWGLDQSAYLAKNYNYSCLSNDNVKSENLDTGTGGGDGDVLGLAATGNTALIIAVFGLALIFLVLGAPVILKDPKHVKKS